MPALFLNDRIKAEIAYEAASHVHGRPADDKCYELTTPWGKLHDQVITELAERDGIIVDPTKPLIPIIEVRLMAAPLIFFVQLTDCRIDVETQGILRPPAPLLRTV